MHEKNNQYGQCVYFLLDNMSSASRGENLSSYASYDQNEQMDADLALCLSLQQEEQMNTYSFSAARHMQVNCS